MDAHLITAWKALCQDLSPAFTAPTWITFLHIATGWVLCRSRPVVTNLVCTIGQSLLGHVVKHWTIYEGFFYRADWSLETVSRLLLQRVIMPLVDTHGTGNRTSVELIFDGTTCGRTGRHVAYAGYFKDASAGNTLKTTIHWAHQWMIGAVIIRPTRWPNWALALPLFFVLYRKKADCNRAHRFVTSQQIAAKMIQQTREALPDRRIQACGDGAFATRDVVEALDTQANLVSRIRHDAALYQLPKKRRQIRRGRPAKKGKRLPTPKQIAKRRTQGWRTVRVRKGGRVVKRHVLAIQCLWYHVCRDRPVKLVISRDPAGHEKDDFLFCTDPKVHEREILERYFGRWTIEESIREAKQVGGFEQVQGWCPRTVQRQAPMALIVQTLVKAWYIRHGVKASSQQPKGASVCVWCSVTSRL